MRFSVIGRIALLIGLSLWTISLVSAPMDSVGDSLMHLIHLPFHEAGHVIFSPLGRFMAVLGGSLMQLLVPLICAGVLLFQTGDRFGAAVCVWWLGESLLDLAPYINDARSLKLMLLGGPAAEVEGHDWEFILGQLGWLHLDHALANAALLTGAVLMAGSLVLAAYFLMSSTRRF